MEINMKLRGRISSWATPLAVCGTLVAVEARRPSILLIDADDLGYGDVGCWKSGASRSGPIERRCGRLDGAVR
jgi:hypothetical protein